MTVQKKLSVKKIHSMLKGDLKRCIEYLEQGKPEVVAEYFGTASWKQIEYKLGLICAPFSEYQKADIDELVSELHSYFKSKKTQGERKSRKKSKSSNGEQTSEA